MFATDDFNFNLINHPYQLIPRHCTTADEEWDKYHAHPGMEFIYVHQGTGLVIIDQEIFPFRPGTLMYFQPCQLHRVKAEPASGCYIRSKLLFEPALVYPFLQPLASLQHFFRRLWETELTGQILQLAGHTTELEALFTLAPRQSPVPTAASLENFAVFTGMFLQLVKSHWQEHPAADAAGQAKLRHVHYAEAIMRWLNDNFRREFSLAALAAELHLSTFHISHLFKKATGSSITDYLISRRLQEACVLLASTKLTVQEISQSVGIMNFSYFSRVFKCKYGLTPAQYRSQTVRPPD